MKSGSGGVKREILLTVVAAVTASALTAVFLGSRETAEVSKETVKRRSTAASALPDDPGMARNEPCSTERRVLASARQSDSTEQKVEQAKLELQSLKEQRTELQEELRIVEKELREREAPPPYEYDLTAEQWKELAALGRIKYRAPCQMAPDSGWKIGAPVLDSLGLSPDDGETVMDAFRRSNERLWATVKPICVKLVGQEKVVDMLGFDACKSLIEQSHQKEDPLAAHDVQRLVAEVRAGMREPPATGEPAFDLYQLYMTLTGEGTRFEADLSESFGPEMGKRIWHSFPCSTTMRF